jgi:hypothetical protein
MKTISYKPDQEGFSGEIKLRMPLYEERIDFMDRMNIGVDENNNMKYGQNENPLKTFSSMIKIAREFYVSVDVKHESSGIITDYKTYEDLSCDPKASAIIRDVAMLIFKGAVGNG